MIGTATAVARIDVLLSLAEVAAHQGYTRPVLEHGQRLKIVAGRHPVVEYALDGDVFIPNDTGLEAAEGERILLLSGPNMAGKSTYLRQVALITLLAQIGSFVPARSAQIGLVDRIFTRVGAEDDIASGKSTFMIEMEETATILHHATRHSLIILDEIGRGTSTYDGLAIARAVVEHLHNEIGARTLFATHYHELAVMADELAHLVVYTMAISDDEQNGIVFLHRVVPGSAGRSYGVHVARLAGMPPGIVRRAQEVLQRLEDGKSVNALIQSDEHGKHSKISRLEQQTNGSGTVSDRKRIAEANGDYTSARKVDRARSEESVERVGRLYAWQSDEARMIADELEQIDGSEANLDGVDIYAITPLDALNLLFLLQRKRSRLRR